MTVHSSLHVGVSEGTVIRRIYWAAPTLITIGETFDNRTDALREAIRQAKERVAKSEFAPERVTVDERWRFDSPDGGGLDTVINRETFETLEEADRMLALAEKYGRK